MREKIKSNIEQGRYRDRLAVSAAEAYTNRDGGWTDHLLSENVLFSHRENDYVRGDLQEKLHVHDYYELTLVAGKDSIEYVSEGEHFIAERGMVILSKPNHFHMFRTSRPLHYDRYVIYFKNEGEIFPMQQLMRFLRQGTQAYAIFEGPNEQLLSCAKSIERALCSPDAPCALSEAYLSLCELFLSLSLYRSPQNPCPDKPIPNFIGEIKGYIDENYLTIDSVSDLAKRFFYSREHISRSFKQYYNTSICEYILEKKLLSCKHRLKQGEGVESAARASGFVNLSSFVKVFKSRNGCTPSEFRSASFGK